MTVIKNLTRNIEIKVRFTEAERDRIAEKMEYASVKNREQFMRQAILNGYNIKVDSSEIRKYISLLSNFTSNVNQLVRRANATGNIYETDVAELKNLCANVQKLAQESLAAQREQVRKVEALLNEIS